MKQFKIWLPIFSTIAFAGCAHSLHMTHVSDSALSHAEYSKSKAIEARSEQFSFLGFTTDTDYVDQAYSKLAKSCPNGSIEGITTEYSTDLGFLSWTNIVNMRGLCTMQP